MDSNCCHTYRVVLDLIFVVVIYQQTLALCQEALHTVYAFRRLAASSSVSSLQQTKVRFFTCRPFRIPLRGACSWKLYFACFDVGCVSFKTRNLEFGDRDIANQARCCRPYICEETFSRGVGDLDVCPGRRAEEGANSTSQVLSVLSLLVCQF